MKILVFGAGIIGKIFAAHLHQSGADVTLLARGVNYENINTHGIVLQNVLTGEKSAVHPRITTSIDCEENYDLLVVTIRLDQLESAKSDLNKCSIKTILFLMNQIVGLEDLPNQFPKKEIILGFPGFGGTMKDKVIEFVQIKQQKTTLGTMTGETLPSLLKIKHLLDGSGIKVHIETNMIAWLQTHAVFITCISAAITAKNGDSRALGEDKTAVKAMVGSIAEGFAALKKLGIPIRPGNLKTIFLTMPKWFSVMYWSRAMKGTMGTLAIAPHAKVARKEMQLLANDVLNLVHSSPMQTPRIDNLLNNFINNQ